MKQIYCKELKTAFTSAYCRGAYFHFPPVHSPEMVACFIAIVG